MSEISSINFKKSNPIQTQHNDRKLPPSYLIGGDFEVNHASSEALQIKNAMIENAMRTYQEKTKQKFQAKSYEWSAVVNIKDSTTMQNLEKLAEHLNKKYGFQCYQIAIHRDEGHINEQGEKEINQHAHLEFITLNKENGRNMWRREFITPKVLREMQTEVAEILDMARGQDKRISKRQRIEPRKYAQMKEKEKKNNKELLKENQKLKQEIKEFKALSAKEVKARIEQERKTWIAEQGHTKEDYAQLRELTNKQYKDIDFLEKKIQELKEQLEQQKAKNENLSTQVQEPTINEQQLQEIEHRRKARLEKTRQEQEKLDDELKKQKDKLEQNYKNSENDTKQEIFKIETDVYNSLNNIDAKKGLFNSIKYADVKDNVISVAMSQLKKLREIIFDLRETIYNRDKRITELEIKDKKWEVAYNNIVENNRDLRQKLEIYEPQQRKELKEVNFQRKESINKKNLGMER